MSMYTRILAIIVGMVAFAGPAFGQVPNRFAPGTPAKASEVNANFEYLAGQIQVLQQAQGVPGPTGPTGPTGPAGTQGPPGPGMLWAYTMWSSGPIGHTPNNTTIFSTCATPAYTAVASGFAFVWAALNCTVPGSMKLCATPSLSVDGGAAWTGINGGMLCQSNAVPAMNDVVVTSFSALNIYPGTTYVFGSGGFLANPPNDTPVQPANCTCRVMVQILKN